MNNGKEQLKEALKRFQQNEYALSEGEKPWDYMELMLQNIGDVDPELRDDLIYSTICDWICSKNYFSAEELRRITSILTDENHLFYHIGNDGDDTVFTRTFSILAICVVLYAHREKPFMDKDMFVKTKDSVLRYYREEKDLRGYLWEKGWAHGAAHGADALDELVLCSECNEMVYREILEAIQKVLYNGKYSFCNEEDERITRAVFRIIREGCLSCQTVGDWLEGLTQCCDWDFSISQYITRINAKNLVRCLYFKLMHYDSESELVKRAFKVEEKLNRFLQVDKELLEK